MIGSSMGAGNGNDTSNSAVQGLPGLSANQNMVFRCIAVRFMILKVTKSCWGSTFCGYISITILFFVFLTFLQSVKGDEGVHVDQVVANLKNRMSEKDVMYVTSLIVSFIVFVIFRWHYYWLLYVFAGLLWNSLAARVISTLPSMTCTTRVLSGNLWSPWQLSTQHSVFISTFDLKTSI